MTACLERATQEAKANQAPEKTLPSQKNEDSVVNELKPQLGSQEAGSLVQKLAHSLSSDQDTALGAIGNNLNEDRIRALLDDSE